MATNSVHTTIAQQHGLPNDPARAQDGDEPQRHQQHAKPCLPAPPVIGRLDEGKSDRRTGRHGGGNLVAGGRRGRQKPLHVDLARCAAVGRGLIAPEVFDGCRRHEGRDRRSQDGSGISHLDLGRRPRRLRCFRRCGARQLRTRIRDLLSLAPRGLVLLGSGDTRLRDAMTNLLLRRGLLSGLEPALAVAVEPVDPALAGRRRLAGPRQALLFRFRGSRRRGLPGSEIEPVCKSIRRRRRCRQTCEQNKSGKAKSQMTGHGNPGVAPPHLRPLAATWVTMRLKSGIPVDSFRPGKRDPGPNLSLVHEVVSSLPEALRLSETSLASFRNPSPGSCHGFSDVRLRIVVRASLAPE